VGYSSNGIAEEKREKKKVEYKKGCGGRMGTTAKAVISTPNAEKKNRVGGKKKVREDRLDLVVSERTTLKMRRKAHGKRSKQESSDPVVREKT